MKQSDKLFNIKTTYLLPRQILTTGKYALLSLVFLAQSLDVSFLCYYSLTIYTLSSKLVQNGAFNADKVSSKFSNADDD